MGIGIMQVSGWNIDAVSDVAWPSVVGAAGPKVLFFTEGIQYACRSLA